MRTLLVSALVASASAASAFYEASEYGDAPASLVAGDCSAKAQAFLAVSAPGKECDPVKVDWCSHATCKTSTSSFYEACKADPAYASQASREPAKPGHASQASQPSQGKPSQPATPSQSS